MEKITKDLRADEEKRQDAFDEFLLTAQPGQEAKIKFCGEKVKVKVNYRRSEDLAGARPENQRISLEVLTKKSGEFPQTLVFDTVNPDNTELISLF